MYTNTAWISMEFWCKIKRRVRNFASQFWSDITYSYITFVSHLGQAQALDTVNSKKMLQNQRVQQQWIEAIGVIYHFIPFRSITTSTASATTSQHHQRTAPPPLHIMTYVYHHQIPRTHSVMSSLFCFNFNRKRSIWILHSHKCEMLQCIIKFEIILSTKRVLCRALIK